MKKFLASILAALLCVSGCGQKDVGMKREKEYPSRFKTEKTITLADGEILLDEKPVNETGAVYISRDIIYYEEKEAYTSGNPYGEGDMGDMHTKAEADAHTVLNITKSGAYRISGTLSRGQIRVDLGKGASQNPDAVVELILDTADITCTVAPAILFMNVYECDKDHSKDSATSTVDTSGAGAVLVLADKSVNNIKGAYVEKIFKDTAGENKLWKQDGAIYSYMSMNVYGPGTLNLEAENEGIDTELHLTIHGGNINICSQNDGINTNEEKVSVTTINGGNINILAGLGGEGDGIDSNGWLVINGGNVFSSAHPASDAGLDSDLGSYINGGKVIALGAPMDWPESDSAQVTINLQFSKPQKAGDAIVVKNKEKDVVFAHKKTEDALVADRTYLGAILSCPEFEVNAEYTVFIGGTISGDASLGIYPKGAKHTDGVLQGYIETDFPVRGGRPPQMPDGEKMPRPDRKPPEFDGERPHRFEGPLSQKPTWDMPHRGFPENQEGEMQKTVFFMKDKVNLFTGVNNASE